MPDTVTVDAGDARLLSEVFLVAAKAFGSAMQHIPHFGDALEASVRMGQAAEAADLPDDPVPGPAQIAIMHHEMLAAYQTAGFDNEQAFAIVLTYISANASASAMRQIRD
jgi:hypothetical protein